MRVIAGSAKGHGLKTVDDDTVRPMTDRTKTALFNILNNEIPLARVLDLYAGSGSVGIEALSRGATHATFVDRDSRSKAIIAANLKHTKLSGSAEILYRTVSEAIGDLIGLGELFDLVFFDPPFVLTEIETIDRMVAELKQIGDGLLTTNGQIIFRHPSIADVPPVGGLYVSDRRRYGVSTLTFLKLGVPYKTEES